MALIFTALCWVTLQWLNVWTGHGDTVEVPDVRGLSEEQAAQKLTAEGLIMEIADSVYENKFRPGMVVDQNPHLNTLVKPGRVVYITINAKTPKMVTVPRLTDISARQAHAILDGLGLTRVTETPVISEFKDLVLGATANGQPLVAGARIPINSVIVLKVGDGMDQDMLDSLYMDSIPKTETTERLDLF